MHNEYEVLRSACLWVSVCLSARIHKNPRVQSSRNFLHMLAVAEARSSSDDNAIRYVLPVLWMTSYFHIICRMCQARLQWPKALRCGHCYFTRSHRRNFRGTGPDPPNFNKYTKSDILLGLPTFQTNVTPLPDHNLCSWRTWWHRCLSVCCQSS